MRRLLLPTLSLLGLAAAALLAVRADRVATVADASPAILQSPYADAVAGSGVVEAHGGNIAVGSPVPGIVTAIPVKVGDRVQQGDPLFRIDTRDLQARLATARATVASAEAALRKPLHRLQYAQQLLAQDPNALSSQALDERKDDAAQARAALALARARLAQLQTELARHTVRAPVSGRILQLKLRPGEYVAASATAPPLLLLGDTRQLDLRVDVDAYDAWRVRSGAAAVAWVRGHPELKVPLQFDHMEPHMVAKTALTGVGTERTDTRVLQLIYRLDTPGFDLHTGQQLQVFIQAGPPDAPGS